jgi:alcohol dehydrogenase class IV
VTSGFTWRDGERTIRFGRGVIGDAVEVLGGEGYALLTTERAAAMAPGVVEAAAGVHMLGDGYVDELAGELLGAVARERIVALGGGRVVDTAKALAAASGGTQVAMAVPTTLSGAEMTRIHRRAAGADQRAPTVRARVVVNDPALSASQPPQQLAASALNALGHAVEGPCTPLANPVATLAAHDGARLLARSLSEQPDREGLALGALLAGYVIDSTGYGLHHVLSQTLVRIGGAGHAPANAVLLPHTTGALAWRFPERIEALGVALEGDPAEVAARMCRLAGTTRLRDIGLEREALAECAKAAAERPELDLTPPRADRAELLALYEGAW